MTKNFLKQFGLIAAAIVILYVISEIFSPNDSLTTGVLVISMMVVMYFAARLKNVR